MKKVQETVYHHESPEGVVFIPIHFAESSVNKLTNDLRDITARIPDFKQSAVKIEVL